MNANRSALLLVLLVSACQATQEPTSVSSLYRAGQYDQALALAASEAEAAPDDAYHVGVERMAEVAVLMDKARTAALAGDQADALEALFEADSLAPGHPVIAGWIEKVVEDLNQETLERGGAALMAGDLPLARQLFERALVIAPESEDAKQGLARTLLLENHRKGMGNKYYQEGVRSLKEYWLGRAGTEFAAVEKYAPGNKKGADRSQQVAELLADDRVLMADDMERQGLYHAARNEYRIALLIDETNKVAKQGLERMDKEVEAYAKLGEAERAALRGDFKEAKQALVQGRALTDAQDGEFKVAKIDLDEARWKQLYTEATDSEADGSYEHAVKLYDQLLQETGYYEDAVARRQTLLDFIKLATRLWGEAQASKDPAERHDKLEQIATFWPEYKNIGKQLEE